MCVRVCMSVIESWVRTILGCFWWLNFIIYVFTSTWKRAEVPSGLLLFPLSHTFFPFYAKTHKSIYEQIAVLITPVIPWAQFFVFLLFRCVCICPPAVKNEPTQRGAAQPDTLVCLFVRGPPCLHALTLVKWNTCCVCPLRSPVWSIASWLCQRQSCHGISANPINQTVR